jgi:hypothetical protein
MISRENFAFTIGYEGHKAIVDAKAKRLYAKLDAIGLAEKGQYRAGFAWALYGGDEAEIKAFLDYYNRVSGASVSTVEQGSRLFGVTMVEVDSVLEVG